MTTDAAPPRVLLDTCSWLWLASGDPRLATAHRRGDIEDAGRDGRLFVAPISMWEIAMKAAKGKLALAAPTLEWIQQSKRRSRLRDAPMTAEVTVDSTELPGSFHQDPADRLIIATARHLGAVLVTGDKAMVAYGAAGFVRVWAV